MANSIDLPLLYDPFVKKDGTLTDLQVGWFSLFVETLIQYLTQFGILIPQITTSQRDSIQNPQNGQMIYNTTTQTFQGYENGAWKTFTLV